MSTSSPILGVNLAWQAYFYGHDLSNAGLHPEGPAYDGELLSASFRHLAYRGCRVVRFWLFEFFEGLELDQTEAPERTKITGIAPDMLEHIADMLARAEAEGILIYWALLDAARANNRFALDPIQQTDALLLQRILIDTAFRKQFLQQGVAPLIEVLRQKPAATYAIDLMNEPEGRNGNPFKRKIPGVANSVPWKYVRQYLGDARQAIREAGFEGAISVGFRHYRTIRRHRDDLDALVDFYDFHRYNRSGNLPKWRPDRFGGKACIIGEFGTSRPQADGIEQREHAARLLKNARSKGYSGCLLWRYNFFESGFGLLDFRAENGSAGISPNRDTFEAFRTSFLAGTSPDLPLSAMDDPAWKHRHERPIWDAIQQARASDSPGSVTA